MAAERLARFSQEEGVLFVGKAQEKTPVFRTQKRHNPRTGQSYAWLVRSTAMVNHYYFYCVDKDFGPFFIKFCSYFPYNAKLCINGHEYLKRQLNREGIPYEALDNGVLSCDDPARLQALADRLSPAKIDALLRKWLKRLPDPVSTKDHRAGCGYDVSILQAEFALTQVLDRPASGRVFFEEVVRENLDLGRPDKVQLIFNRRVTRRTCCRDGQSVRRIPRAGCDPLRREACRGRDYRPVVQFRAGTQFGVGLARLDRIPQSHGFRAMLPQTFPPKRLGVLSSWCPPAVGQLTSERLNQPQLR